VSVHQNSYPRAAEKGAQVFFAPASEDGKRISGTIQNMLNANLDSHRSARPGDYYVLQCSDYASVLVECGFLSNPDEEKLLVSATYQEKVAYAIFSGIHAALQSEAAK
jgi:N-acetylmuramoyl-L-alanine amidase